MELPAVFIIIVFGDLFATPLLLLGQFVWLVDVHVDVAQSLCRLERLEVDLFTLDTSKGEILLPQ